MVFNDKSDKFRIAEKTRDRIIHVANELGYQHVKTVRHKRLNRMLICIFVPVSYDVAPSAWFSEYARRYIANQHLDYEIVTFPYELGKLSEKALWISSNFAAGAVLISLSDEDIAFIESREFDIPLVLYNRSAKGYPAVLNDDYHVGYKAMSHFINRGHKRFAIITPGKLSRSMSLREVGYRDAFISHGFTGEKEYLLVERNENTVEGGYAAMENIFKSKKLPTALFLPSDSMVKGVIHSINQNGLAVPKDIEIITYGFMPSGMLSSPSITSFMPPLEQMSRNCIKIINNSIITKTKAENVKLSFEAECVFRESCPEK